MKPSLFKNELLATSDALYTWIFEGLWCLADKEGRLEDRPRKIHLEINAGRAFEGTEAALNWLAENGFIDRYKAADGMACIQVIAFHRHQKPHPREATSVIPAKEALPRQDLGTTKAMSSPALSSSSLNPLSLNALPTGREARKRGSHRCPEDFKPDLESARNVIPDLDVEAEASRFRDFEFKTPRSDWPAAWRNWIRTCKDTGRYAKKPDNVMMFAGKPVQWG